VTGANPKEEFQTDPGPTPSSSRSRRVAQTSSPSCSPKIPPLRERMLELGYRVLDGDQDTVGTTQLFDYLTARDVPVPRRADYTRAELPRLDLLERMIRVVDRCPK
jgi:hypothetical protein